MSRYTDCTICTCMYAQLLYGQVPCVCRTLCSHTIRWHTHTAVLTVVDTTITHTLLWEGVIVLYQWTSTYLDAHPQQRLSFMEYYSYRRKSNEPKPYRCGTESEQLDSRKYHLSINVCLIFLNVLHCIYMPQSCSYILLLNLLYRMWIIIKLYLCNTMHDHL